MKLKAFIKKHLIGSYFIITFFISWMGALIIIAPKLLRGETIQKMDGIMLFPVMLIGPVFAGIFLTRLVDGRTGLRGLFLRMKHWHVKIYWYAAAFFIPPLLIVYVLFMLSHFVSPIFTPGFFAMGILFGIPAGILEEIGWMGYAYPKMLVKFNALKASILLGLLWGFWHLPVIDFLGAPNGHGIYLLPYFLAFIIAMCAIRILICWIYCNTKSILLCQLMHIISTGVLTVFSPAPVSAAQETFWYFVYAAALWIAVTIIIKFFGKSLMLTS